MSKKFKKILSVVVAMIVCVVSMVSVVSNAVDAEDTEEKFTLYTTSFGKGENKYVLWEDVSGVFNNRKYEPYSYVNDEGKTVNRLGIENMIFIPEKELENKKSLKMHMFEISAVYFECEGKVTVSFSDFRQLSFSPIPIYFEEEEWGNIAALESYLLDNDIEYELYDNEYYDDGEIKPLKEIAVNVLYRYDEMMIYADIQKKFGVVPTFGELESGGFSVDSITDIVNEYPEKTLDGDANNDGQLTIADATAIVQFLGNADEYPLTEQGMINADCYNTGDGVTGKDAAAIQMIEAGLAKSFEEIETL